MLEEGSQCSPTGNGSNTSDEARKEIRNYESGIRQLQAKRENNSICPDSADRLISECRAHVSKLKLQLLQCSTLYGMVSMMLQAMSIAAF